MHAVRLCLFPLLLLTSASAWAQDAFDAAWYDPGRAYVKVAVVEDGPHRVTGADLVRVGVDLAGVAARALRLEEDGREVPLRITAADPDRFSAADHFDFVGRRNRGDDEAWAYFSSPDYAPDPDLQSSDHFSLYTDTTYYWLSWKPVEAGEPAPLRYAPAEPAALPGAAPVTAFRDTVHVERDRYDYRGDSFAAGYPPYTRGEAAYMEQFRHNVSANALSVSTTLPLLHADPAGDDAAVAVKVSSATNSRHRITATAEGSDDAPEADWNGYDFRTLQLALPAARIPANGTVRVTTTSDNTFGGSVPNLVYLDYVRAAYDRRFVADGGRLRFAQPTVGAFSYALDGFSGDAVVVFDEAGRRVLALDPQAATFALDVRSPGVFWAAEPGAFRAPAALVPDVPSDLANPRTAADYVILTTRALWDSAQDLAAYRGGEHRTLVVDVQDVFDQFDYGRPRPIAVRRFVRAMMGVPLAPGGPAGDGWATPPQFLMLWGDALYPDRDRTRRPWEVLSFGASSSDDWFAMQAPSADGSDDGWTNFAPLLAIGRMPVRTNGQGATALTKIEAYERAPFSDWQKRAIFLAGGNNTSEQRSLEAPTLQWSDTAADAPTGLDTLHFFKNTQDPLDPTFKDSLSTNIERGVSWISYFGHSSATSWAIVTEPPEAFDNAGRLPIVLSLGCYTGDFALEVEDGAPRSFGEDLLLASLDGSIVHYGASNTGSINASAELGRLMHEIVFDEGERTLGSALAEMKRRYNDQWRTSFTYVMHLLQYGLLGDPALKISLPTRPDLRMSPAQIETDPVAPALADSLVRVHVRLENVGLVPSGDVAVRLTHTPPDGRRGAPLERTVPAFARTATVVFEVPLSPETAGTNRFSVVVDPGNAWAEENEMNNAAEREVVVFSTGLALLSPRPNGIVPPGAQVLTASVARAPAAETAEPVEVVLQLDASDRFDPASPHFQELRTTTSEATVAWPLAGLEPGLYYWRGRIAAEGEPESWYTGAFLADDAATGTGWGQQPPLFEQNTFSPFLRYADGAFAFETYTSELLIELNRRGDGEYKGAYVLNGQQYERLGLGFSVLVLDGGSGAVKAHASGYHYPIGSREPEPAWRAMKEAIATADEGDHLFIRTRHRGNPRGLFPDSVQTYFRGLGSTAIDTLTYAHMWAFKSQIGVEGSVEEIVDPPESGRDYLVVAYTFEFPHGEGSMTSVPIGPAKAWQTLSWDASLPTTASAIDVEVLDGATGRVLRTGLTTPAGVDLSGIDARQHPTLRLRATLRDPSQRATPQLEAWRVSYAPVPELALAPEALTLSAASVPEGAPLHVEGAVRNLSPEVAEGVVIRYLVTDAANDSRLVGADTLGMVTETVPFRRTIETAGLPGRNRLQVTVEQPGLIEPITFNNTLIRAFSVEGDRQPPALGVVIDGDALPHDPNPVVNLQDPALPFVGARPRIDITITDENAYAALGDSSAVEVMFNDRPVPFSALTPLEGEDGEQNRRRFRFEPDLTGVDSTHTLRVLASDASGNQAPLYQTHFRTQSQAEVERVYPYPNPMSTHTRFAFRLRGASAGDVQDLRLRIFTVSGRLVREFDLVDDPSALEAGTLRIGWNQVFWDGRDGDGDLVGSGVYLYTVSAGTSATALDVGGGQGVEKVVVLR